MIKVSGLVAMLTLLLCACETVEPWERGTLAKPEMQWETDIMESRLQGQVYTSKEAASGGSGAAGGGCGCN
ncbi:MAG: DUF4266 domain-containing protein [Halioglobus sp.]